MPTWDLPAQTWEKSLSTILIRRSWVLGPLLLALALGADTAHGADGWQVVPIHGADVRGLAVDPSDGGRVLAGTSGGQVYRSDDGGATWRDAGHPLPFPGWVVGSLVFDPNTPGRLWAGMWGLWGSGGFVAYSDDLGASWTVRADGLPQEAVYALAPVPGAPGRLYAAMPSGVWGTQDAGLSWRHLSAGYPEMVNVSSLLVDPFEPRTVYAGTWRRAYRSDDGGATWRGIFEGMVLDSEVFSLHAVASHPGEIWASTCGWVYSSADRGGRWERHVDGLDERRTPAFLVLPDGSLLAGTVAGIYRSADRGKTWWLASRKDLSTHTLARPAGTAPGTIYAATEGSGVWISNDGGRSFHPSAQGMTNVRVTALAADGDELFAAVSFAGPASGVYRRDGDAFIHDRDSLPTVLDLVLDGGTLFAATEGGLYERTGGVWRQVAALGDARIDEVTAEHGEVAVRAGGDLWRRVGGLFVRQPFELGRPASIALAWDRLWVLAGDFIYTLSTGGTPEAYPVPVGSTTLAVARGALVASGRNGVWWKARPDAPWQPLTDEPMRALATGDDRYPLLLVANGDARLIEAGSDGHLALEVPVPAHDVRDARVVGSELLLATAGYGLLRRALPELAMPPTDLTVAASR